MNKLHNRIEFEVIARNSWLTLGVVEIGPPYEGGGNKHFKNLHERFIQYFEFFAKFHKDCFKQVI